MINKLYQDIAAGLMRVRPCTVYQEDVPQHFAVPSFLVQFYDQNPKHGINQCLNNTIRIDVAYFPDSRTDPKRECWAVGEALTRELKAGDFKIKNRNLKITDNVLHFLFDVTYREYREGGESMMRELSLNTDIQEV